MARTTNSKSRKKAPHFRGSTSASRTIQRFASDIKAYCVLIEGHAELERTEFLRGCGVLLPRLYSSLLQLPEGKHSDAIIKRRHKVYKALHPDIDQVIFDMTLETNWKGPIPKTWDPIARDWMRSVHLDDERIASVRSDPYFHTVIPYGVKDRLWQETEAYLNVVNPFWMGFCPYRREEVIGCSLGDALVDIWADLKEELLVYEKGSERARQHAIWMWRLLGHGHWGRHVVQALNAIEWLLTDAYHDED